MIHNILLIALYVCVAVYNIYSNGILVLMGDTYSCLLLIFLFNGDIISTFICLMVRPSINPVWPPIQPFISIQPWLLKPPSSCLYDLATFWKKKLVYTLTRAPIIASPLISSSLISTFRLLSHSDWWMKAGLNHEYYRAISMGNPHWVRFNSRIPMSYITMK